MVFRRATQTREVDVIAEFMARLHAAYRHWDYAPVEEMLDPEVELRTKEGVVKGKDTAVRFLKEMGKLRYRASIVAPKGGLVTVLITPVKIDAGRGKEFEQIYRVYQDKIVEIIDLGRTQDMIRRPQSQPI